MRRLSLVLILSACGAGDADAPTVPTSTPNEQATALDLATPEEFAREHASLDNYWHAGLAELTRYSLRQSRYGAEREGEAVLIFVTEPFLPDAQVKHERDDGQSDVSVLKLNAYRRFYTGIYPYTVMTSTFVPEVANAEGIKLTNVVSEWCGQTFVQLNRREDGVHAELRSYFQSEGDRDDVLANVPFEDALWQRIRRDPSELPTGAFQVIPAVHALRFLHRDLAPYAATGTLEEVDGHQRYTVEIPELGRTLEVDFGSAFPHAISGWTERLGDEVSVATRTNAVMTDYWSHNGPDDAPYRQALGLEF